MMFRRYIAVVVKSIAETAMQSDYNQQQEFLDLNYPRFLGRSRPRFPDPSTVPLLGTQVVSRPDLSVTTMSLNY
jgi:hypothetical protein